MSRQNKFVIILTGPTGVGKTEFSQKLAQKISAKNRSGEKNSVEIINCDVGQFYRSLSIGTAKPDLSEQNITHHMFDIIDRTESISVTNYRKKVQKIINEIWARGNIAMIVGGSLFYILSLFFPPIDSGEISPDKSANELHNKPIEQLITPQQLWQKLYAIDPERAKEIDKNDTYRLQRALQIWQTKSISPSSLKPEFKPLSNFHIFFFITRTARTL